MCRDKRSGYDVAAGFAAGTVGTVGQDSTSGVPVIGTVGFISRDVFAVSVVEDRGNAIVVAIRILGGGLVLAGSILAILTGIEPPAAGTAKTARTKERVADVISELIVLIDIACGVGQEYFTGRLAKLIELWQIVAG